MLGVVVIVPVRQSKCKKRTFVGLHLAYWRPAATGPRAGIGRRLQSGSPENLRMHHAVSSTATPDTARAELTVRTRPDTPAAVL